MSHNDASTDTGPAPDAGPVVDTGTPDHVTVDAGQHAKLIIIHAAPGAPAVRVCFAQGVQDDGSDGTVASLPALPDTPTPPPLPGYPGIFPGTGGTFPDITDLSGVAITPYAILAASVSGVTSDAGTGEKTCTDLIGPDGKSGTLKVNQDYLKLPTIPAKTFLTNHTYMLTLLGCLPNVTADGGSAGFTTDLCGASYNATTGNVSVGIAALDRTPVAADAGDFGAQFAHRSSAIEGVAEPNTQHPPAANGLIPGWITVVDGGPEAGPQPAFVQFPGLPVKYSGTALAPTAAEPFTTAEVNLADPNTKFAVAFYDPQDSGAPFNATPWPGSPLLPTGYGDLIAISLPVIQASTIGTPPPPSIYVNGANYTFVLLGDPTKTLQGALDDAGNPTLVPTGSPAGLHILAFPNDPPVKKLGQ